MSRRPPRSRSNRRDEPRRSLAAEYVVPGERAVVELLRGAPRRIRDLLLLEGRSMPEVEALAAAAGVGLRWVQGPQIEARCPPALARGIIALADPPPILAIEDLLAACPSEALLVALDGVQDPHNLGAILRSAEFFGASGALWPLDRAAGVTPVTIRSSAGATERLPLARVVNLARALDQCKDAGFWVIGTVVDGGRPLAEFVAAERVGGASDRVVLVLGSEEKGLRRLTRERCDFLATIPRRGAIGSLNVSTAAAVALAALAGRSPAV